jgi:hypothetical protein
MQVLWYSVTFFFLLFSLLFFFLFLLFSLICGPCDGWECRGRRRWGGE